MFDTFRDLDDGDDDLLREAQAWEQQHGVSLLHPEILKALIEGRANQLEQIAARHGVPAAPLMGIWGLESDFGASTGGFHVVEALATLAWEGRRAAFFRGQLLIGIIMGVLLAAGFSLAGLRFGLALGLLMCHRWLPARRLPVAAVLPGVLVTVIAWALMAQIFAAYLVRFNTFASTYASLSGLFAAMFFTYLAALVLILGGEINRVIAVRRPPRPVSSA